jgi:hypothetical protein
MNMAVAQDTKCNASSKARMREERRGGQGSDEWTNKESEVPSSNIQELLFSQKQSMRFKSQRGRHDGDRAKKYPL